MEIKTATTEEDIAKCRDVLLVLRPHLLLDEFVSAIKDMMSEGYQLAYIEENGKAAAAIGFRYQQYLYNGKHFYIDDLSTLPESRGKGYGSMLVDYLAELARAKGYKVITLDSGYTRNDAHRLYLNKGFTMVCHHFSKSL